MFFISSLVMLVFLVGDHIVDTCLDCHTGPAKERGPCADVEPGDEDRSLPFPQHCRVFATDSTEADSAGPS